jgi:hypothetical protein
MSGPRTLAEHCPKCRRVVMTGPNADTGLDLTADPQPLTALGEALALMAGRATVELRWRYDHYEIAGRDHFRIRGSPAGTNGLDVLIVHECDREYGGTAINTVSRTRKPSTTTILPDEPPY